MNDPDDLPTPSVTSPVDLDEPAPDLEGVALGAGRLASNDRFRMPWVEWDLDGVDVAAFERLVLDTMGDILAARGLGRPHGFSLTTRRRWDPIDGAQPPDCAFTDTTVHEGMLDGTTSGCSARWCTGATTTCTAAACRSR